MFASDGAALSRRRPCPGSRGARGVWTALILPWLIALARDQQQETRELRYPYNSDP